MVRIFYALLFGILVALLGTLIVFGTPKIFGDSTPEFEAQLMSKEQVYDGDTIQHVLIKLLPIQREGASAGDGEVWPDLILKDGYLYAQFNLRIAGIDAPERHPATHNKDGALRSTESRGKEHAAAMAARQALIELLWQNEGKFSMAYPQEGKYAGRLVAEMFVGDVSVREYMIENGYALPYDGGTKASFDFGD